MKKIVALVLTAAMVMGMCTAVFAGEDDNTKSTTVSYEKEQSYTWSVPATLTAGGNEGTVSASNVYIPYNTTLTISITNGVETDGQGNKTITLTDKQNAGNSITASVTYTNVTVAAGISGLTGSGSISIAAPGTCNIAGTYEGTITFTASVASTNS